MWEYVLTDEKTTGPAIAYYPDGSNEILAEVLFENGEMISGKCPDYNSDGKITGYSTLSQRAITHYNQKKQLNCDM